MILLVFLIFIVAVFIAIGVASSSHHSESIDYPEEFSSSTKQRYQIGASVSPSFYNDVQNYCRRNGITTSDLIRNAVRDYMGLSNLSPTSKTTVSSDSWKCPKCGIVNSNAVGTCACGTTKPKDKIITYYEL